MSNIEDKIIWMEEFYQLNGRIARYDELPEEFQDDTEEDAVLRKVGEQLW